MTPFPLSKVCNLPGDEAALTPFYSRLDSIGDVLAGQHPIRRWEYAMALKTIQAWDDRRPGPIELGHPVDPLAICDVGGAGSNFWKALAERTTDDLHVIDPSVPAGTPPPPHYWSMDVEKATTVLPPGIFTVLTAISVIEHVDPVRPFLKACHTLLKPGGLLFLTTDYCDAEGPDVFHYHWMRKRIYNADLIRKLVQSAREVGFRSFGTASWEYHGPMVYDYAVASLALIKV